MAKPLRTPWYEWAGDEDLVSDQDEYSYVYICEQLDVKDDVELLAVSLRTDGVALTLRDGYEMAEDALYVTAFYGYVDGDVTPEPCDGFGVTPSGDDVDEIIEVTVALIP